MTQIQIRLPNFETAHNNNQAVSLPFYKAAEHGLGRRITTYEYRQVIDEAVRLGLTDGYMQEKSSAREEYTPPFDLEGV